MKGIISHGGNMKLTFEHNQTTYQCDLGEPHSIAIPMDFDGPQPNHFGVDRASRETIELDGFVGSTLRGGSCNVESIKLVPHCNGTHTECVGHIVSDHVCIGPTTLESLYAAIVISIIPVEARKSDESYRPELEPFDKILTCEAINRATDRWRSYKATALVIRTLPNDARKSAWVYSEKDPPPFFTVPAIERINELGFEHLLVDIPSLDRLYDEGLLTCHHLFWNVPEKTHQLTPQAHRTKTVTEMVMIPDSVKDGFYLLNLQIPDFLVDSAPSRPILFAAKE